MSQMFHYKVWPQPMPDMLYTVDDFIDGDFQTKKGGKLNHKILLHVLFVYAFLMFVGCIDGEQ